MTEELKIFLDAIESAASEQLSAIEARIGSESAAIEIQAEKAAASAAEAWKKAETERIRAAVSMDAASRQSADRRARLARREQYAAEVFDAVRERLAAYTASKEYPAQLAALLSRARAALGEGECVIWLRREDMALGKALKAKCPGADVREGDFALGGLWLSVGARRADMSFDTALDSMRGRFAEIIGMEIEP